MQYTVDGTIGLAGSTKTKLGSDIQFDSPSNAKVKLSSESAEKLIVQITFEADNKDAAQERAEGELDRLCDLLGFFCNVTIANSRTTGMSWVGPNGVINLEDRVILSDAAELILTLGAPARAELSANLTKAYTRDFLEIASVWRYAIGRTSTSERFFALYRLMDQLLGNQLDGWIQQKNPTVQMLPKNRHRRQPHTIYTYLRDNIHYKPEMRYFPSKEIQQNLPKFQKLVKQCILEKFAMKTSPATGL